MMRLSRTGIMCIVVVLCVASMADGSDFYVDEQSGG